MALHTSLSVLARRNAMIRYLASIVALAIALELGRLAAPLLDGVVSYALIFLVVAFSSWYCGIGPAIAVTLLSLATARFWIPPQHTFRFQSLSSIFGTRASTTPRDEPTYVD